MRKLKSSLILLFLLPLSITILGTGCEKDEPEEEQVFSTETPPGFSIYKTNGDYFDLVDVGVRDETIFRKSTYACDNSVDETDSKISYRYRTELVDNYILDQEAYFNTDAFLNITISEYYTWEIENDRCSMPSSILLEHILDTSPYSEFWELKEDIEKDELTRSEINELIKNNNLSLYFEKLK